MEAKLRDGLARRDAEQVRQLLTEALAPMVDTWLQQPPDQLRDDEFEVLADQLADTLAACLAPGTPTLSDDAVSRAGIYEEHP